MSTSPNTDAVARELYAALRDRRMVAPLSERLNDFDIDAAYQVSLRLLQLRQADGERLIGKKIGVTSAPVQQMLGVSQPDFGFLTDAMQVADGTRVSLSECGLIQPRAEGEIAFILKDELQGPGIDEAQVLSATEVVCPCFEIVDSRITDWKIAIEDTIADNASCGIFVLGEHQLDPATLDLAQVELNIHRNGEHVAHGTGAAVQGHPATAVAWLANTLGRHGISLLPGEIILSGSLAPLLPIEAGDDYELALSGIGGARISFSP